jgi:hypothetical protein
VGSARVTTTHESSENIYFIYPFFFLIKKEPRKEKKKGKDEYDGDDGSHTAAGSFL